MAARSSNTAFIIAGEASGDFYGGELIKACLSLRPEVCWTAYGGSQIESAGGKLLYPLVENAVIGISEAIRKLPKYLGIFAKIKTYLKTERPDFVVLIDYGGLNLKVAKFAQSIGLNTVYFIPPKVWIWNSSRAKKLAKYCDLIVTLFPFEPSLFNRHGGNAVFLGHPLVDVISYKSKSSMLSPGKKVALLPGSRPQEIENMLEVFLQSAQIIAAELPGTEFVLPCAPTVNLREIEKTISSYPGISVSITQKSVSEISQEITAAISTSGTVTLEIAMAGVPQVIAYKVSRLSAFVFRTFVKAPYVGLPNIVAQRSIVPELLQEDCSAESIAKAACEILKNGTKREEQLMALESLRSKLGEPGAMKRIAKKILSQTE